MFARYQDILAGQVDEDGQGINNVGKALERVGINIRDAEGGFKDFSDVLDELYPKWGQLSEVEQANITKALAGVRQRESLLVLLENETKYRKALTETMNAEGLASERYATYLDSVEAAQNRVTASWESLVMSTATSDMVKDFYDGASAALNFVEAIGGIPTVLKIVIPLLIIFNAELIKTSYLSMANSISGVGTSLVGLGKNLSAAISLLRAGNSATSVLSVTMGATAASATALIAIFASLAAVVYTYNEQIVKTQKAGIEENVNTWEKVFTSVKKDGTDATEILKTYRDAVDAINKTHEESGIIADLFVNKQKLISAGLQETVSSLEETTKTYQDYKKAIEEVANIGNYQVDENGKFYVEGYHGLKIYVDGVDTLTESEWKAKYASEALTTQIQGEKDYFEEGADGVNGYKNQIDALAQSYVGFSDTLKLISDDLSTVNSLMEKSATGQLDFEDISKIPDKYLDALTVENGQLKLNIDLIKEKQIAEAEAAYQAAVAAGENVNHTEVLRLYYEQLKSSQYVMLDGFKVASGAFSELAWNIANDAAMSGNSFVDMQGKALGSADAIYSYLTSGDAAFNDFVRQAANATGMSVEHIMGQIMSMVSQTYENTTAMINSLNGMSTFGMPQNIPSLISSASGGGFGGYTPIFTPAPSGYQYPGGLSDYSPSSGGGGSSGGSGTSSQQEEGVSLEEQINEAREDAIDGLEEQLDLYEDIIDARKKILDTMADEREYQRDVEDKNKEILKIQTELNALQFDNSEEANARRLELQDELFELNRDLEDLHYEESVEDKKDALDAEFEAFNQSIQNAIAQIEGIQASSVEDFANQLALIISSISGSLTGGGIGRDTSVLNPTSFHSGAKMGVVGKGSGTSLKSNELYAKLMAGEVVSTPSQIDSFMNKTLPQIAGGSSSNIGGDVKIEMPINVTGSLDKSVMPDLNNLVEKVLERIQTIMNQRGYNRRADLFQI